ncbi:MAG: protein kinase domain-containing protein [Angustibacter sp.]
MTQDDRLSPPYVPGYDLLEPLGRGATSVVWRARPDSQIDPRAGGAQVAIKIVTSGPDAERELAVLSGVRHPHLLELHEVVALGAERLAIVTDLLEGGTLASVVAARGRLHPGEVVTVLVPLAQVLGALHATGVLHGDLAPGNVLFTLDGRPALTDLGTTRITGEPRDEVYGTAGYVDPVVLTGGDPTAASDVYGLGALGWLALTGSPPPSPVHRPPLRELAPSAPQALVAAIEAAVDPDPAARPDPTDWARELHAAVPAEPVWRSGAAPSDGGLTCRVRDLAATAPEPVRGARHRVRRPWWRRRGRLLVVAAVVVGLAAALGPTWWARPSRAAQPVRSYAVSGLSDAQARSVVAALATTRAAALGRPGRTAATGAAPGSAAAQDDARALAQLRSRGARYAGLRLTARDVRVVSRAPGRAWVRVVLAVSAYDVVVGERVVEHVKGRPRVPSRLELAYVPGQGWRVARVESSA